MAAPTLRLDRSILARPVTQGARMVALEFLADARRADERLSTTPSAAALHDFRVALRRLRSWLRAFEPELESSVRKKDRRALREVARATNLGRDVDVQLAFLRRSSRRLKGKRRKGARWLARYLATHQRSAGDPLDTALLAAFEKTATRLARELAGYRAPARRGKKREDPALASALAAKLPAHARDLKAALRRVRSPLDEKPAHKARIAAKRLRYLVEPVAPFVRKGSGMLTVLRAIQDDLGALHDSHILANEIAAAIEQAAVASAARRPARTPRRRDTGQPASALLAVAPREGLLAMAEYVRDESREQYRRVRKRWLRARAPRFGREVAAFATRLADTDR